MEFHHEVSTCASCLSKDLLILHDFGNVPLAGYFPLTNKVDPSNLIFMQLLKCCNCGLVQVNPNVDDQLLFLDYRYLSKYAMDSHFEELKEWIILRNFDRKSKVLEIGSNDGTLMDKLTSIGMRVEGVDPAENVAQHATARGHKVYNEFFSSDFITKHHLQENYDIIIACNSFAHISDIRGVCEGIFMALKNHGKFIVEVQAWPELVRQGAFDFVYHEHRYYYDLRSIHNLCSQFNLFICEAEVINSHGNSYRLVFEKNGPQNLSLKIIEKEIPLTIRQVKKNIKKYKDSIMNTKEELTYLKSLGHRIIGFGASGRGNMILGQTDLHGLLTAVFDESPERIGREMGFTQIPIKGFEHLLAEDYDSCLILAWNHTDQIVQKWPHKGKLLIKPLPELLKIFT